MAQKGKYKLAFILANVEVGFLSGSRRGHVDTQPSTLLLRLQLMVISS